MTMTCGVGSPYYMAPEMLRGDKKYTRAVDSYSFGILCVELWNQHLPYIELRFETQYAFAVCVMDGTRPEINDDCPQPLVELFSHCWSGKKHKRPAFETIVKDLEPIVNEENKNLPEGTEHVKERDPQDHHSSTNRTNTRTISAKKKSKKSKSNSGTNSKSKKHHHQEEETPKDETDEVPLDDLSRV